LGINKGVIHQWTEGVDFEMDHQPDRYSKTPYSVIYQSRAIVLMAARECLHFLEIGKILPFRRVPWVENRMLAIVKASPTEPGLLKYSTCMDMTASGVNTSVKNLKRKFRLWNIEDYIAGMGRNHFIVKQDLQDMFLN
jgi:hypothetical protein